MSDTPETLVSGFAFLECPRWHDNRLWMVDVHRDLVIAVDENGGTEEISIPGRPGGMGWLKDGSLAIIANDRKIMRYHDGRLSTYCDLTNLGATAYRLNDMVVDAAGRCYVGEVGCDIYAWMTENLPKAEKSGVAVLRQIAMDEAGIFVIEDGKARVAATGLRLPNGAAISPDQTRLVVAESFGLRLSEYTLTNGELSGRRMVDLDFVPDGVSQMDDEGGIWIADPLGAKVHRVDVAGTVTTTIPCDLPVWACELGGSNGKTLYLCLGSSNDPSLAVATRDARIDVVTVDVPAPR